MSNFSDKFKQILGTVAPLLGTAVGGPFGGMAGALLAKALGVKQDDTQAMEAAVTSGDPDILLKLKQADNDFKVQMETLGITRDKLVFDDIANARAREIAVKDDTPRQLAWVIIGGFIAVSAGQLLGLVIWPDAISKIPPQGWLLVGNISGYLANEAKQCAAYYFGSSLGSVGKDSTIADIAKST
jgi:hypothetical protein